MKYKKFWWILVVMVMILLAWTGYDWWEVEKAQEKKEQDLAEREVVKVTPVPSPTPEATPVPTVTPTSSPMASTQPVVYTSEFSRILDEKCVGEVGQEAIAISDLPLTISPQVKDLYQIGEMVRCEGDDYFEEKRTPNYQPNTRHIAFGGSHYSGGNSLGFVQVAHPDSQESPGMGTGGEIFLGVERAPRCVEGKLQWNIYLGMNGQPLAEPRIEKGNSCLAIDGGSGEEWILERLMIGPTLIAPSHFQFFLETSRTIGDGRGQIRARIFSAAINAWRDYPGLAEILRKYGVTDQNGGFTEKMAMLQHESVEALSDEEDKLDQELLTEFAKSPLFEDMKQRMETTLDGISFKN